MHYYSIIKNIAPCENVSHLHRLGNKPFSIGVNKFMEEIWKDIPDYEGYYQASNLGKIRGLKRKDKGNTIRPELIMKGIVCKNGYLEVKLCRRGINKRKLIHRLVAQAFIPNPDNKPCVNHIDGNKKNNNLSNLEWSTHKENTMHAVRTGLFPVIEPRKGELSSRAILRESDVLFIRSSNLRTCELARKYNLKHSTIRAVRIRKSWKHI